MEYKHSCIIDSQGYYRTLVLVLPETDEAGHAVESIQYETLGEGEQLLDAAFPTDFIKPRWDGSAWVEGASPEEAQEQGGHLPDGVFPTDLTRLRWDGSAWVGETAPEEN